MCFCWRRGGPPASSGHLHRSHDQLVRHDDAGSSQRTRGQRAPWKGGTRPRTKPTCGPSARHQTPRSLPGMSRGQPRWAVAAPNACRHTAGGLGPGHPCPPNATQLTAGQPPGYPTGNWESGETRGQPQQGPPPQA